MRRQKRERSSRVFTQGFRAGLKGHSMTDCPYGSEDIRATWFSGWRDGRKSLISGYFIAEERVNVYH